MRRLQYLPNNEMGNKPFQLIFMVPEIAKVLKK